MLCDGQIVARHHRSWAKQAVITDPAHAATAQQMRQALATRPAATRRQPTRQHSDGHPVELRALPDYDALFGVDFTNPATKVSTSEHQLTNDHQRPPQRRQTACPR